MNPLLLTEKPRTLRNWLSSNWIKAFLLVYGLWVGLPFLAPVLMHIGWVRSANAIYFVYSFFCHQLPERSYFFFGQKTMYSLGEIQAVWQNTVDPYILRKFIGTQGMGWKMAWSDRMISFYGGFWLFGLLWLPFRHRIRQLSWWRFLLLILPMAVDVVTHFISDSAGIGQGFRDYNLWLVSLTNNAFPTRFYAGDALGSFNSWMRLITGALAAMGIVWNGFPFIDEALALSQRIREIKIKNQN